MTTNPHNSWQVLLYNTFSRKFQDYEEVKFFLCCFKTKFICIKLCKLRLKIEQGFSSTEYFVCLSKKPSRVELADWYPCDFHTNIELSLGYKELQFDVCVYYLRLTLSFQDEFIFFIDRYEFDFGRKDTKYNLRLWILQYKVLLLSWLVPVKRNGSLFLVE